MFVPGRIEVLGKHADYAGGRTMVAAVERGFCVAALPRDDHQIVVIDAASGETIVFLAAPDVTPQAGSWANYPMTVARRVAQNFPGATRGADIALVSDLPAAAGMSSSSALTVAVFLALAEVNRLAARDEYWHNIGGPTDLAGYLGTIENGQTFGSLEGDRGVGTFSGSEDQTAIFCDRAESHQPIRLLPDRVREDDSDAAGPYLRRWLLRRGGGEDGQTRGRSTIGSPGLPQR